MSATTATAGKTLEEENKAIDEEEERQASMMAKLDMVSVLAGKELFDSLMQSFPVHLGKSVSKREREELRSKDSNLVYGEITFETLGVLFEKLKKVYGKPFQGTSGPSGALQTPGGIFYDLGAGTGKGVIGAAILHNFDVCYGIELLEGLYTLSLDALNAYNTRGKARLTGRESDTHCQFIHGDFLKMRAKDWRDGDVVFINSTCFDENVMTRLAKLARGMKKGSFVISVTKRLPSNDFKVLEYEMYRMSWGEATIFIMQKQNDPKSDADDDEDDNED